MSDGAAREDEAWPVKLTFQRGPRRLQVAFDDGETISIPFTILRAYTPSAETKGHVADRGARSEPVDADITVTDAEPIGTYAVRIVFSDGHRTGLYTWDHLRKLGAVAAQAAS